MKEIALEDCPIHKRQPYFIALAPCALEDGKMSRELIELIGDNCLTDWRLERRLHELFPASYIFLHGSTVFCPECAKKNPTPSKHNKFGCGFCSQHSLQEAKRNWNKAVRRFAKRSIRKVLEGK